MRFLDDKRPGRSMSRECPPYSKRSILFLALAYLGGVGCTILAIVSIRELRRYRPRMLMNVSKFVRLPGGMVPKEQRESGVVERGEDAALLEKTQAGKSGYSDNQIRNSKRRRNILLATAIVALVVIVVLGGVLAVSHPWAAQATPTPNPYLAQTVTATERAFERGIIYPRFTTTAYGNSDLTWQRGIVDIKAQTSAQWLEIPILFSQSAVSDTHVALSSSSPDVQTFVQGVQAAHAAGFKIFFVPLMTVRVPGGWSGMINLPTAQLQQAWFDSYWNAVKPYIQAAQTNGVEQVAVATELQLLQQQVPTSYWDQLFARAASVFPGPRTYDMNWSSLSMPMPPWLKNPLINMIGVSSYIPLTDVNRPVPTQQVSQLWQQKIKTPLDKLSSQFGKKVLITEIGYRSTADAFYQTWLQTSSSPSDPQLQAEAYNVALLNVFPDTHIGGIFFWGWDGVNQFTIKGQPAAQVLQSWYSRFF